MNKKRARLGIVCLLAFIVSGGCFSCMDDALQGTTYNIDSECLAKEEEKDMRLKVSVPRTYSSGSGGVTLGREERIDTLDVLVFAPVAGSPTKFLRAAATGTPVKDEDGNIVNNVFEVIMPLGKDMDVHVFANSHYDLVRSGVLGAVGTEMETLLGRITQNRKYDLQKSETLLPMHGSVVDITVDKDSKDVLPVSVLRSVAKVSVQLAGTVSDEGVLTGGELTEFKLRELYTFYPADSGRIATADTTQFYITKPDSGNVKTPTLPASLREGNKKDSLSIINTADVKQIESIYLYENRPWTKDGDDNATTRIVVGGIFTDPYTGVDKDANGNPRVSYYRINLQDMQKTDAPVQLPFLRNHHYIFKINSVAAPGYDTPRQAADGKPINMNVTVIDWRNELHESIFDGENYFDLSEKKIVLPRYVNSQKSIEVESNVDVAEWKMYFKNTQNGVTTPQTWFKDKKGLDSIDATANATLENARYKVTKATNKITVEVLKNHSELPAGESREDTLILKVKNLRINIHISQKDVSADDWSNGGDLNVDLGEDPNKPIDIGLDFLFAKGNLVATRQADGSYTYAFADEQGYYNEKDSYFCWNTLEPTGSVIQSSWDDARDPCRKIDGGWYIPTKEQSEVLINSVSVWGTYTMENGRKVNGRYFGTSTVPSEVDQDKYVFLAAAGERLRDGGGWFGVGSHGIFWTSTPNPSDTNHSYYLFCRDSFSDVYFHYRNTGYTLRCVKDK